MSSKKGQRRKKAPPSSSSGGRVQELGDSDGEQGESWSQQTEQEKRKVRKQINAIYERLKIHKEKNVAGGENGDINEIIKEANEVLGKVRGTHEAMEDAKMFKLLCQTVREMSEDTNTNEKKFHFDEYAMLLGNRMSASFEGGMVRPTKRMLENLGEQFAPKFRRTPTLIFISGAVDTEAPDRPKQHKEKRKAGGEREKIATKTTIIEKNQVTEQLTDRLVQSTRKILEGVYRQNNKKPVGYFEFVIDPASFGTTVENMFHVSFLIKQRVVMLTVNEDEGLPYLEPIAGGKGGGEESSVKNQAVISISYQDWVELTKALEISTPAIAHPDELRMK